MKKRKLLSHDDLMKKFTSGMKADPKIAEVVCTYGWQYPSGFMTFMRVARLAAIGAPGHLLKSEIQFMEDKFKNANFASSEIKILKKILFDQYPNFLSKISQANNL